MPVYVLVVDFFDFLVLVALTLPALAAHALAVAIDHDVPPFSNEINAIIQDIINPVHNAEEGLMFHRSTLEYLSASQAATKDTSTTNIHERILVVPE